MPKEPMLSKIVYVQQDIHVLKKKYPRPMIIFSIWCGVLDSVIMADSLMPEAQQSIIVIINSYYF